MQQRQQSSVKLRPVQLETNMAARQYLAALYSAQGAVPPVHTSSAALASCQCSCSGELRCRGVVQHRLLQGLSLDLLPLLAQLLHTTMLRNLPFSELKRRSSSCCWIQGTGCRGWQAQSGVDSAA